MVPKKADIKYFMHQISLLVAFKQGSEPRPYTSYVVTL